MSNVRPLFASDIDRTLHPEGVGFVLWKALADRGLIPREVWYGEEIMRARRDLDHRRISFEAYSQVLVEGYFRLQSLKGTHPSKLIPLCRALAEEHEPHTFLFSRLLLQAAKHANYFTAAISGSPHEIVQAFAERWGFNLAIGSELHLDEDGHYTANDELTIRHYHDKEAVVRRLMAEHMFSLQGSIAIGDSFSDLSMLALVEYPVAINPTLALQAAARERGIVIVHEYDDVIIVLRPAGERGRLEEVGLHEVLPSQIADHMIGASSGRIKP
ncbi:hypothetical protein EXS71_01470 [Candidatus Uhrbacteria bacterium]|nr:hypothetical protein [Candidatus Uhrbacteria bacterium]